MTAKTVKAPSLRERTSWKKALRRDWHLYLLLLVPVVLVVLFNYGAYPGLRMVFYDYKPAKGYDGSKWVGMETFAKVFRDKDFLRALKNSIIFNLLDLVVSFPMPIVLALMLNEVRSKWFKRSVQTISYLPHFISIVVICSMLNTFGSLDGLFNNVREMFGMARVNMNAGSAFFMPMFIGSAIWQGVGWGSIIYLSALSNVDTSLYDVANLDGANRFQKIRHISTQDYTKILLMMNETNRMDLEVISTYVYRMGIQDGRFEFATAVNLFVSLVSLILVVGTNYIVRFIDPEQSIW